MSGVAEVLKAVAAKARSRHLDPDLGTRAGRTLLECELGKASLVDSQERDGEGEEA